MYAFAVLWCSCLLWYTWDGYLCYTGIAILRKGKKCGEYTNIVGMAICA